LLRGSGVATTVAQTPKAKRINRAIELLEQGQPIYYTGSHSGTEGGFEQGKKDAQIYADYISYDMEHAPFGVKGLAEYMRGLVAGGPTKSGHRTRPVIVNVPVNGIDEAAVRGPLKRLLRTYTSIRAATGAWGSKQGTHSADQPSR
jgi:hypothetical protein